MGVHACASVCACSVSVSECVTERERKRERESVYVCKFKEQCKSNQLSHKMYFADKKHAWHGAMFLSNNFTLIAFQLKGKSTILYRVE